MNVRLALLTCFGLGRSPVAPGTVASAAVVCVCLAMLWLFQPWEALGWRWVMMNASLMLVATAFSIACIRFGSEAETNFGRKDPGSVVADEVAGQAIALLALPWRDWAEEGAWQWNLMLGLGAFLLFRGFDIVKPPPIRSMQRYQGGWGILVDDLLAGAATLASVQILIQLQWYPGLII